MRSPSRKRPAVRDAVLISRWEFRVLDGPGLDAGRQHDGRDVLGHLVQVTLDLMVHQQQSGPGGDCAGALGWIVGLNGELSGPVDSTTMLAAPAWRAASTGT